MRHKKNIQFILILSVLIILGFFGGKYISRAAMIGFLEQRMISSSLRSSGNLYFEMNNHLNSPDEYKRLSGYYLLYDYQIIKVDFLTKRFLTEKNPVIKRTI